MSLDFSDASKLQTRDGREVRIYATDGVEEKPIHGAVRCLGGWHARTWTSDGSFISVGGTDSCDLIPKPQRVTGWVNVYETGLGGIVSKDRESCIEHRGTNCIGQIYIDAEVQT